jgi:hypothetical protein
MDKQNMRFLASENPHRFVETSFHTAKCTVYCAISKEGLTGQILMENTTTNQWYL